MSLILLLHHLGMPELDGPPEAPGSNLFTFQIGKLRQGILLGVSQPSWPCSSPSRVGWSPTVTLALQPPGGEHPSLLIVHRMS